MTENTQHLIQTIFTEFGYDKTVRKINKYGQTLSATQTKSIKDGNKLITVTQKLGKGNKYLGTTLQETTTRQNDFTRAMRRALIVAPVWLAIRSAMVAVLGAMKDIVKVYGELDKGMRKVLAVATFTSDTQKQIYADLESAARRYFSTSSTGMKNITEAMYQLGTAGLSTEQILQGFEHVLNLAIGTFGDVTTAGRLMAGIFNVFGDELARVGDTGEQMQYVSDLLTTAWKNNQIELSELNTALGYLASSGKIAGLGLEELVATASVMSDALLRGGKGGRLLARGFIQLAKESKKLEDLGVYFDPTKPLDFYNVMNQLHTIFLENGRNLDFLNDLIGIFGVRGIRAVGGVLEQWEKFNKEVKRSPEEIAKAAEQQKKSAEETVSDILQRAWHNIITTPDIPGGASLFKETLKNIFDFDAAEDNVKRVKIINKALSKYGKSLNLTKAQVKSLAQELELMASPNLAAKLRRTFGISYLSQILASSSEIEAGANAFETITKRVEELEAAEKNLQAQKGKTFGDDSQRKQLVDYEVEKLKESLGYRILEAQKLSQTQIVLAKIDDLLNRANKSAKAQGKELLTIGDVLTLNKQKIQSTTAYYEDLLKLGVEATLNAEQDRLSIQQSLIDYQVDQLKAQGATVEQQIRAKILFEDSLGKARSIVEATQNELDLRRAINDQKEIDLNLSSRSVKLAEIAQERGIEVAKELGDLLQGRIKFEEFEAKAMDDSWDALVKNFPEIVRQQRAMQLLIKGIDPFTGQTVRGATEIPIDEEYLRNPDKQNTLIVDNLKLQMAIHERELQKQTETFDKQVEIKDELLRQTEILKQLFDKNSSPEVNIYFKDKPVSKDDFVVDIKTDGSPISEAIDERIEKQ